MDAVARVAWGMPAYGPFPYAAVYASHMTAMAVGARWLCERGGKINFATATDKMYTHSAENFLVRAMLETDATHLFMTEMDMILPCDVIPRLLELQKPIASGLYFLREGNGQPCLYTKMFIEKQNPYPHSPVSAFPTDRPFKLGSKGGCPGLGCVLIAREVFEKITFPWFDLKEKHYGSDMFFYTKVWEQGYEVWVDPAVRCGQIDYTVVDFDDYVKRVKEEPSFAGSGVVIGEAL